MKYAKIMRLAAPAAILTLLFLGLGGSSAAALKTPSAPIGPTRKIEVPAPQLRTAQQMTAAATRRPGAQALPLRSKPFLTRIDAAAYRELKVKPTPGQVEAAPAAPQIAAPKTPLTSTVSFDGVDASTAGWYPPDTHGAAGRDHFVEVTNSHLDVYLKSTQALVQSVDLNSFFGYTNPPFSNPETLFAPRVIYDDVYQRWIFSADAFAESDKVQYFFFAVSQTSDPTGTYYIYKVNVSDGKGPTPTPANPNVLEWDFPQLGMDRNALIFTADFFDKDGTYTGAQMFPVAKSLVYSGQAFILNLFTKLDGTLAPPIVLDDNPYSYLAVADFYNNTYVTLYTLQGSGTDDPLIVDTSQITVPAFDLPPYALQYDPIAATTANEVLDTGDARFGNASTQIGNSLFQVHTIDDSLHATPRFYEFDTANKNVIQSGTFYASDTSYDFNATIAANRYGDVFVTWTSTDPTKQINAQVRVSGRLHSDSPGIISSGSSLFDSSTFLSEEPLDTNSPSIQAWGTYSAVCLDPANPSRATAWVVNEYILTNDAWGSRIGRISLPAATGAGPAINLLLLLE